jgi:hypothetical protein
MTLTTLVAAVTYGWIEGWALVPAANGTDQWLATQSLSILGHFSVYSVAMGLLFACITGGFSLIKGSSMFRHGKRYFLITFAGNYPFAWFVEDFSFFWFYPPARLNDTAWTNWAFGGTWLLDPWRSGVRIWLPNWYGIVLVFWACMMFLAHRCTVYDNLVKDEIAREILPDTIKIPQVEVKKPELERVAPRVEPEVSLPRPETEAQVPRTPDTATQTLPEIKIEPTPEAKPKARSPEAQAALEKLKKRWTLDTNRQAT